MVYNLGMKMDQAPKLKQEDKNESSDIDLDFNISDLKLHEGSDKVLEEYRSFLDGTASIGSFIKENFAKDLAENPNFTEKIRENLYNKVKNLVAAFFNKKDGDALDADKTIKDIQNLQTEKELLLSTIKLAKKSNEDIDIKDILALDLKKINSTDFAFADYALKNKEKSSFTDEQIKKYETLLSDKDQMEKIYRSNYSENTGLQDSLTKDFNKFITGDLEYHAGSEMYILKYGDDVVSFNRFDSTINPYKLNFKSFNVDDSVKGSGIGNMMSKATLDKKAKEHTILADCIALKPISSFYVENGFIAKKFYKYHDEPCLSIIRADKYIPEEFKTKNITEEEILRGIELPVGTIVRKFKNQNDCDFNELIQEDYVLTRYFFNKNTKEWVIVFEPIKRELNEFL